MTSRLGGSPVDGERRQGFDPLSVYELPQIGSEFRYVTPAKAKEERLQNEARRGQLIKNSFRMAAAEMKEGSTPTGQHFKTTRKFETKKVYSQSMITWFVFLLLGTLAGICCGVILIGMGHSI